MILCWSRNYKFLILDCSRNTYVHICKVCNQVGILCCSVIELIFIVADQNIIMFVILCCSRTYNLGILCYPLINYFQFCAAQEIMLLEVLYVVSCCSRHHNFGILCYLLSNFLQILILCCSRNHDRFACSVIYYF